MHTLGWVCICICVSCFSPVPVHLHAPLAREHRDRLLFHPSQIRLTSKRCTVASMERQTLDVRLMDVLYWIRELRVDGASRVKPLGLQLTPRYEGETPHRRTDSTSSMLIQFPSILPSPAAPTPDSRIAVFCPKGVQSRGSYYTSLQVGIRNSRLPTSSAMSLTASRHQLLLESARASWSEVLAVITAVFFTGPLFIPQDNAFHLGS